MSNEVTKEQIAVALKAAIEAEEAADAAKLVYFNLKDRMAQQICPHKVGDIIEIEGYSHTGKMMIVDKITSPSWSTYEWRVVGRVIKKDGDPSLNSVDFNGGGI